MSAASGIRQRHSPRNLARTGLDTHLALLGAATGPYGHIARFTDRLNGSRSDVIISQDTSKIQALQWLRWAGRCAPWRPHCDDIWPSLVGTLRRAYACLLPDTLAATVIFGKKTVVDVRAWYRRHGAERYKEGDSGLNKRSLAKFERTLRSSSGLRVIEFLTKLPGLRELTTVLVAAVLTVN